VGGLGRVSEPFVPAWWCRGPHAQTLWPYLFRRRPDVALKRERVELPDGDFIDLDWTTGGGGPIVLVLHGLEGSSRSKYARGILRAIHDRGWRGVLMHFRGCSGETNRLVRGYHSGETTDLDYLLAQLHARAPHAPLAVVGYSLGGNVLLKWLGETGATAPLRAAVAVSVPYRLDISAARLERGFSRAYQWSLVRRMRRSVLRKRATIALPIDDRMIPRLRTFREFDEHVTAPLHGFRGADHYYSTSSSRRYLAGIALPTLLLHALDDPFMTPDTAPGRHEASPAVRCEFYPQGGHVGFVSGRFPWSARYWLEERIPDFLAERFRGTALPAARR
jgi:predicted alpha/beta-fold hydrolase